MSNNEYPEEIYNHRLYGSYRHNSNGGKMVELAYDLGKEHAQADTGDWHNLTEAIASGEPIDFEKLDGRKIRLTKGQSAVEDVLKRDLGNSADSYLGWDCLGLIFLGSAWDGSDGWTLWVDGEIPMKKQTADELPFGTSFNDSHGHEYVVVARNKVQALYGNHNVTPAGNIIVVEVLGMYGQKESE